MIKFTAKIKEFTTKVDTERKIAGLVDSCMTNLADMLETDVRRLTPVITGNLQGSIHGEKTGFCKANVFSEVEYSAYVEYGNSAFNVKFTPRAMFRRGAVAFEPRGMAFLQDKLSRTEL